MSASPAETVSRDVAKKFSKYLRGTFKGFQKTRKTKYNNEHNTKTETTALFWTEFEQKAKNLGVDLIGYTKVDEIFVFYNLKIYGKNAIVLGMEMKWEHIKTAPSAICEIEVFRVYKELGDVTIELTEYLKEKGYKSEAHHPFGGKLLFGPHAVSAGLGVLGQNGLIITPQFGPRQRWSIITTDAELPKTEKKNLDSLQEFCEKCGACIRECKGNATYKNPLTYENSPHITHINRSKCIQSILENTYCSYCLKICPQGKKT
ncbi:MAG: putative 3-chloro-4-hydroxyphenylacetate reductive dehalogenase [Promethearchaeota archaeon]|nr:MAG: putative 3-chloro-4-hydroxyphenylacetate reductive dehalogenase [Candidatus Lokiarchaeota archaeon]